jgi:benzoyl-CoA 2,3-dioxygenase component B
MRCCSGRSGDTDNPRILGAFNEKTPDWLAFYMFTHFTDRDGKFQLCALAESSFDPLARTTKFMLTEEAHHMFVGEAGISRILQRTCEVMNELHTDDPSRLREAGVIDLPTIQRYLNFHFAVTIDLFGADQSSNAATFYGAGLKGRFDESKRGDDHRLHDATYKVLDMAEGKLVERDAPMLNALNEVLRDDFIKDSVGGIGRWNRDHGESGHPVPARAAAQGVQPQDRLVRQHACFARWARHRRSRMGGARARTGSPRPRIAHSWLR